MILCTLVFGLRQIPSLNWNLANVVLEHTLWQDGQQATQRQKMLSLAAQFYSATSSDSEVQTTDIVTDHSYTMISAVIAAEYYRRLGDSHSTAMWLNRAATAEPLPRLQRHILLPANVDLTTDGSIILRGNSPFWEVRPDTRADADIIRKPDGTAILGFKNSSTELNRAVLSWKYPMDIFYHHQLRLDVRATEGCSLVIETVIDDQRVRHQLQPDGSKIYVGVGKWEQLNFVVEGTELHFIDLLLTLDSSSKWSNTADCTMEIASVVFVLDNTDRLH